MTHNLESFIHALRKAISNVRFGLLMIVELLAPYSKAVKAESSMMHIKTSLLTVLLMNELDIPHAT